MTPTLYRIAWFDRTRGTSGVSKKTFELLEVNSLVDELNADHPTITHTVVLADSATPEATV